METKVYLGSILLTPEIKAKISYDTTAYWQAHSSYIPEAGEIVVYSDYKTVTKNNETVDVPGIKVGDGSSYGIDLPFADESLASDLIDHISNTQIHITSAERASWNNKLCLHENPVIENNLILYND